MRGTGTPRVFLLSPAFAGGQRARLLMNESAQFDLACRLRSDNPPTLGEVFAFLSGLYFRGKLAYAQAFTSPRARYTGILVITPTRGLLSADLPITTADLRAFAEVDIAADDPRYRKPLERDLRKLVRQLGAGGSAILLGSIATGKYADVLLRHLGSRLLFPGDFVGRGDMSRGGLLLRSAADEIELDYIPVQGAMRTGKRPPKLPPRRYSK
ncbi:MAG: hypothetical protein ABI946_03000 [Chthoniobacterales bacterium]